MATSSSPSSAPCLPARSSSTRQMTVPMPPRHGYIELQWMEHAIPGHPDTTDRELGRNHADQKLCRSCSVPASASSLVAIAAAAGRTRRKPTPSCCLPRPQPVRRYAAAMSSPSRSQALSNRKSTSRRPRSTPSPHGPCEKLPDEQKIQEDFSDNLKTQEYFTEDPRISEDLPENQKTPHELRRDARFTPIYD